MSALMPGTDNTNSQGGFVRAAGDSTFDLNHIALTYTNGSDTGPAIIREHVTVDRTRRQFSGTFTLTQYLATVTPGHEFDESTPLVTITGVVSGTRITP